MKLTQNSLRPCLALFAATLAAAALGQEPLPTQHADPNVIEKVHRVLHLEGPRKKQVDAILESVQRAVDREEADQLKGRDNKEKVVEQLVLAMELELKPILTEREYRRVSEALYYI